MRWGSVFVYDGKTFDLSHLNQFQHVFEIPNQGKYSVSIIFSHHCFTEHVDPSHDPGLLFVFGKEKRSFDIYRWQLSQRLPEVIKTLANRFISHTEHQSYFTIEVLNEQGSTVDYEIYFELKKDEKTKRLFLVVKSAYVRDPNRIFNRPRSRKIRLAVILRNVLNDKPIRAQ